jgi:predicted lipoprotein with Yx(FWY)xxD motif
VTTTRTAGAVAVATLVLAGCGSTQPAGPTGTREVPGVGTVLVDDSGRTLYFTDSDRAGDIKCVGDCLRLWHPVPAPGKVTGTDLGTVTRPDGTSQLTYQAHPLYTFSMDSQDKPASGHNAMDSFGGTSFTWHAIVVGGDPNDQPPAPGGY